MTFVAISKERKKFNNYFPCNHFSLPVQNGGHFENLSFLSKSYIFLFNLKQKGFQNRIKITATLKRKFYKIRKGALNSTSIKINSTSGSKWPPFLKTVIT